jgi:NAD(P)H-hydrate epimerase
MPGAADLCLQGALKGGAGLVSWIAEEATFRCAPRRPLEVILRSPAEGFEGLSAMVVGPGWGLEDPRREQLRGLLAEASLPLCLDASALTLLAEAPEALNESACEVILTPHPREFSRLSGLSVEEIQGDRVEVAKAFAIKHGCCVVLKGARTVVASSSGDTAIIEPGNPGMATAGSGDVLAGIIGAFVAQGMAPYLAARAGALLHACAGDLATAQEGEAGMVASDIILSMGTVWRGWNR